MGMLINSHDFNTMHSKSCYFLFSSETSDDENLNYNPFEELMLKYGDDEEGGGVQPEKTLPGATTPVTQQ